MFHYKRKFIWILSVLLISGFLATSLISYQVAHRSISQQISESALPLTSDNIYSEIQQDLLRPIFISSLMAQDTFVRDWVLKGEDNPEALLRYLNEIQQRYNTITSFFVSASTLRYYHPSGVLKNISAQDPDDEWYFRARALPADEHFEINIDTDTADHGRSAVFVNYKVYDFSGQLIGITGVGLALETVAKLIETYQQRYGRRVYFIDRQGEVKLHGGGFENPLPLRQREGINELATQILTSPSGSFSYQSAGKTIYLNSRLVPEFKWYLMVEQQEDPIEQQLFHTLLGNLLISLGITIIVLILAHLTIGGYQRRLEEMAATDKLTGVTNRQVFDTIIDQTIKGLKRHPGPLSLIIFDIDHFKRINDNYGHLAGDLILKTIASLAREMIRESDTICRWGGEEFIVLLPDCDHLSATELAERMRLAIANRSITAHSNSLKVTASFGIAQIKEQESIDELINRADQGLYRSKRQGRNRVSVHEG